MKCPVGTRMQGVVGAEGSRRLASSLVDLFMGTDDLKVFHGPFARASFFRS